MAKSKWEQVREKLNLIECWARDGLTNEQIANNLGLGKTTFYAYLNEHEELSEVLKKGKEIIDYEVENALLKRALGYEYEETIKEIKANGDKVVKVVSRHVAPDVTAQIYWLNNRKPRQWRNRRNNEENNNTTQSLAEAIQKAYENKAGDE